MGTPATYLLARAAASSGSDFFILCAIFRREAAILCYATFSRKKGALFLEVLGFFSTDLALLNRRCNTNLLSAG